MRLGITLAASAAVCLIAAGTGLARVHNSPWRSRFKSTPTPTLTASPTPISSPSQTPTPIPTPTPTPPPPQTPIATPSPSPTPAPSPTASPAPSPTPSPGATPVGAVSFTAHGGVADHQGIGGSCSGTGLSASCNISQPVTCSTRAGSNQYTISGYTPSTNDIGKYLIIGMPYGIKGSVSTTGAGGSSYQGQPLVVEIAAVSGQTISGRTIGNSGPTTLSGSSSAAASNSVTNAECDLGSDNSPALQTALNAGLRNIYIPAGSYLFNSPVSIPSNTTITCAPGAEIVHARNDRYGGPGLAYNLGWYWFDTTNDKVSACTFVGTNTYGHVIACLPDDNHMLFIANASNITISNNTIIGQWPDASPEISTFSDSYAAPTNIVITNNTFYIGSAYGPSIITGSNNTLSNNWMIDGCYDNEPNDSSEANADFSNSFSNSTCVSTGTHNGTWSVIFSTGGWGACPASGICNNGQTVKNIQVQGPVGVQPTCGSGFIGGVWSGVSALSSPAGRPSCSCGSQCFP